MRKWQLICILFIIAVAFYWRKFHAQPQQNTGEQSTIDRILNSTQTGEELTGDNEIDTSSGVEGALQYAGGGEYDEYSDARRNSALENGTRVIVVFERDGDPTAEALYEDIVRREARIPYNTVILFANIDTQSALANRMDVDYSNTIVYVDRSGNEIRRSGNGVIMLSQLVRGIDGLLVN